MESSIWAKRESTAQQILTNLTFLGKKAIRIVQNQRNQQTIMEIVIHAVHEIRKIRRMLEKRYLLTRHTAINTVENTYKQRAKTAQIWNRFARVTKGDSFAAEIPALDMPAIPRKPT